MKFDLSKLPMRIAQKPSFKGWVSLAIRYFFQGLLIIAPFAITGYVVYNLFIAVDSWLPLFKYTDGDGKMQVRNYGLGIVLILAFVIVVGYLSSFFINTKAFNIFDNWLEKTPGIKLLYSTTKDFFSAFAGNKKKFDQPVLAAIENVDVFRIGFITESDLSQFGLNDHVAVYLPASYSISGYVYLVPLTRIKRISGISAADAMKFAISGGVSDVED